MSRPASHPNGSVLLAQHRQLAGRVVVGHGGIVLEVCALWHLDLPHGHPQARPVPAGMAAAECGRPVDPRVKLRLRRADAHRAEGPAALQRRRHARSQAVAYVHRYVAHTRIRPGGTPVHPFGAALGSSKLLAASLPLAPALAPDRSPIPVTRSAPGPSPAARPTHSCHRSWDTMMRPWPGSMPSSPPLQKLPSQRPSRRGPSRVCT